MTVFNGMPFVKAAVQSIFDQTLSDFEFIIVNDGSTDGTAEWLKSLDDPRLRIVHQENAGQQDAARTGISLAKSGIIARMDGDDIALPKRLQKQVDFLTQNKDVGLVGSQIYRLVGETSCLPSSLPCDHEHIFHDLIHNRHAMCNSSSTFRKELFETVGGYWDHDIAEDWDMFLRLGEVAKLANIDEPLLAVRMHSSSINGRRMLDSQIHNEFACELARRRDQKLPPISLDEFKTNSKLFKWPWAWLFKMDCFSVSLYRIAIAEIYGGHPIKGRLRMFAAMLCSPKRTFQRILRIF